MANGETRLLNPNVVNSLSSAINGLNIQQAQLALSTKNLTKEQMNQVLVQAGLIASENQIQAELVQSALAQSGVSAETQKAILDKLGLIDITTGEILVTKACTKEELLNALAIKGVTGANAEAIISTLGLTSADEAQIVSKKLLTKAIREQTKAKIANTASSHPMLIGITAIVAATYAAIKASDAWLNKTKNTAIKSTEAYNDLKSQADELNSELQSNCDRIDELNSKEHLTLIESEELQKLKESNRELENQIALKEKLAETELKEARENTLQYFNKGGGWVGNKETHDFEWADRIDFAKNQVEELKNVQNKITEAEKEIALIDTSTVKGKSLYKQKNDELDTLQKSYDIFFEKVQDFNDTFTSLDDNLIKGEDDEIINRLNEFYNLLNETITGVAQTHTDTIKGILAKVDFQDASKQLEELGKNGELSITTLSSRFPELIQYLEGAGISAQELYQYIMALSNPDAINYDNVKKQLLETVGIRDGIINGASDKKLWNELNSNGLLENNALEAYLSVKAKFTDGETEYWNINDWISHIQNELNSADLTQEPEQWDYSTTITQLDTIKEKFDVLDSTMSKLYDADSQIGFDDLSSINEAFKDMDGVEDYIQRLQEAGQDTETVTTVMGDLISSYLEYSGVLDNVTDENRQLITSMLEEIGVANAEEVVNGYLMTTTQEIAEAKQALGIATENLADLTLEEIQRLIEEGNCSEQTKNKLYELYLTQIDLNNNPINAAASINQLLSMVDASSAAGKALTQLASIMGKIGQLQQYMSTTDGEISQSLAKNTLGMLEKQAASIKSNALAEFNKHTTAAPSIKASPKADYKGGSNTQKAVKNAAEEAEKAAKSASDAAETVKEAFEETFDFFDRRVDVLEDALSLLKTNLDNVTGSFAKNNLIDAQLGITEEKFKNYSDALSMYTEKANEALSKLPSDIAQKIRDGAVDLTTFIGDGNEQVVEAVKDYEKWADKVADCKQELAELKTAIRQLELEKFNNIMEDFTNQFDLREDGKDLISKQIDLLKEAGQLVGESFFTTQIDQSKKQLELLETEKTQLVNQMASAIHSGRVNCCPAT